MNRKTKVYTVLFISILLLIWNISDLDFDNLKDGPFAGIVSNIFLILAMIVTFMDLKKWIKRKIKIKFD